MLKRSEQHLPEPEDEQPLGEIVSQLVDEAKGYAKAELNVAKAIVTAKANGLKLPAILLGAALVLVLAGVAALAVAVTAALSPLVGPFLAGLIVLALFGGAAGALAWFAVKKLQEVL